MTFRLTNEERTSIPVSATKNTFVYLPTEKLCVNPQQTPLKRHGSTSPLKDGQLRSEHPQSELQILTLVGFTFSFCIKYE